MKLRELSVLPSRRRRLGLWTRAGMAGAGMAAAAAGVAVGAGGHPAAVARHAAAQPATPRVIAPRLAASSLQGYWLVASDGGIFPFGEALNHSYGSTGAMHLNKPIVGMAAMTSGTGYWLVASDGGIFPFGDALNHSYGSTGNIVLNRPIVGMEVTASGNGYWLVASDGGIFPFGDAKQHSYGSTGNVALARPIVGMARTQSGNGYWLVASDGGIFPFGDAKQHSYGSTGGRNIPHPIVGMARTQSGNGYWLVSSGGDIYGFGDAQQHIYGSTSAVRLNQPVVGMAPSPSGNGYWFDASDGGIFPFGDAQGLGSTGGTHLNQPMVGMAAFPSSVAGALSISPAADGTANADTGVAGIPVQAHVTDQFGSALAGAQVDFGRSGFSNGHLSATSVSTDGNGNAVTRVIDTHAGDSGLVTATVHGTSLSLNSGTITIVAGAFKLLTWSAPSAQTAGTPYTLTLHATDAFGNAANPSTAGFAFSGSAVDLAPDGSHHGSAAFAGPFSGGSATVDVTSYAAESALLVATSGSISKSTSAYTVAPAAVSAVSASPSSATSLDADNASSTGVGVGFTALDAFQNTVPGIQIDYTTTLAHASLAPASPQSSDSNGVVSTTLTDSKAEAGTVTGTVHGSSPAISGSTAQISITPGALDALSLSTPTPTAGTQYTVTATAADHWGNLVNPTASDISVSGTACDPSPNNTAALCPAHPGSFSGGTASIAVTSYKAQSGATLMVSDSAGTFSGSPVTGSSSFDVKPGAPNTLTGTSTAFQATTNSSNGLFFTSFGSQTPATVHLQLTDGWGNNETGNTDSVMVSIAGGSTDAGTLKGDGAAGPTGTVALSNGAGSFLYNPPSAYPTWGSGSFAWTDMTSSGVTAVPASIPVTTTTVSSLSETNTGTSFTADQVNTTNNALQVTYTALPSGGGAAVAGAKVDFSTTGFAGTPTFTDPTTSNQVSNGTTGASLGGTNYTVQAHPTTVNDPVNGVSGTIAGVLDGAPLTQTQYQAVTPSIHITVGAFHDLSFTAPATATAGTQFSATALAADAEGNAVQPTDSFTLAYSSPEDVTGCASHNYTSALAFQGTGFDTAGHRTLLGTAYVARASGLTVNVTDTTSGTPTMHPLSLVVNAAAPGVVTWDPTNATSFTADTGNATGTTMKLTLTDTFCNPVSSALVNVSTALANATWSTGGAGQAFPHNFTTNASGVASFTLLDHSTESGTLTATSVAAPSVTADSPTFTVNPGKVSSLTVQNPGTQVAGTQYTVTAHAFDQFGNPAAPSGPFSFSGTALAAAPIDGATPATPTSVTTPTFIGGVAQFTVTSFKAQGSAVFTLTDTNTAETHSGSSVAGSSTGYSITAGAAATMWVTSSNACGGHLSGSTYSPLLGSESCDFTFTVVDVHGNAVTATDQSDSVTVTLTPGGTADGGSLKHGSTTTPSDSGGTQSVTFSLSGGSGQFTYIAPGILPVLGSGTITWADNSAGGLGSHPAHISISD
jgi:hypothetical protein